MSRVEKLLVKEDRTIKEAMRVIDQSGITIAFVIDENDRLVGTVTDGDVRKALMRGIDINSAVKEVMNSNPLFLQGSLSDEAIAKLISEKGKRFGQLYYAKIPVVDFDRRVQDVIIYSVQGKQAVSFNGPEKSAQRSIKRVLVVGGAGYLGSVLCRMLLSEGFEVRVLDVLLFGEQPILELQSRPGFEFMHGDIRNITTITKALAGVDAVIHLAAIVGDPASKSLPTHTIETNYLATMTLAQACKYHQINRFLFASTCSVYGKNDTILDEQAQLNPVSLYARSKIESERGIMSLEDENFAPTFLRMSTLHGLSPRMRFDLVVNIFAMKAVKEGRIQVFGGEQWRPLLHVEDAARAFVSCLKAPIKDVKGEVFNVGSSSQNFQIKELALMTRQIISGTQVEVTPKELVDGAEDERDYQVSFAKIERVLGFQSTKTVADSIRETADAVRSGRIADVKSAQHYNCVQK